MSVERKIEYEISSGNVFADLELEDADELLIRAQLGHAIRMILKGRDLKQREIGELLEIDQAEVSKLLNGKYHLFSESRLFGFLNWLDQKVSVHITPRVSGEVGQEVVFGH